MIWAEATLAGMAWTDWLALLPGSVFSWNSGRIWPVPLLSSCCCGCCSWTELFGSSMELVSGSRAGWDVTTLLDTVEVEKVVAVVAAD